MYLRVIIIIKKISLGAESEAKKAFLLLLKEETTKDLSKLISAINIVTIFLNGTMSVNTYYKYLKEHLIDNSDQV
jgi:hypothetical protein